MTTRPDRLALEIATTLDDMEALPLHRQFTQKYSESFLRKKLMRVLSIPERKIKRSRAALFNFLIQQHEHSAKRKVGSDRDQEYTYEEDEDN